MRYVGGKVRISKWIKDQLEPLVPKHLKYLEPFMGGGAVLSKMAPLFQKGCIFAGDAHEDLILMWKALQRGWIPPERVSRQEYEELRTAPPSALRGFVGFGSSFSGKWFGGYVDRAYDIHADYMMPPFSATARRAVLADVENFRDAELHCTSYSNWNPHEGVLVYCDPPYAGSLGYSGTDKFNHDEFWETMRKWSRQGASVFVSEYRAPSDFVVFAERSRKVMLRATKGEEQEIRTERLFTFNV